MGQDSTTTEANGTGLIAGDAWFDPIEAGIRERVCGFIEELLEQELTSALGRTRHERTAGEPKGYRNGTRERQLLGSFGPVAISVPRARVAHIASPFVLWIDGSRRSHVEAALPFVMDLAARRFSDAATRDGSRVLRLRFGLMSRVPGPGVAPPLLLVGQALRPVIIIQFRFLPQQRQAHDHNGARFTIVPSLSSRQQRPKV